MLIESQIEETEILGKLLNLTEPYFLLTDGNRN